MYELGNISPVIRKYQHLNIFQAIYGPGKAISTAVAFSGFPL